MPIDPSKAFQLETEFLSGVESHLEQAKGRDLRGTFWQTSRHDEVDTLRSLAAQRRIYDRDRLRTFPSNRRVCLHGYVRRWFLGKRRTGVAIASTISPLDSLLEGGPNSGRPVTIAELQEHVRRIITDPSVPHVVGICSTTGFAPEVRNAKLDFPNTLLVLVEPKEYGGWQVVPTEADIPHRIVAMFDPETTGDKLNRVRDEVHRRSADLLLGGLSAHALAEQLSLPRILVRQALERVAAADPELRLSRTGDEVMIYRGAPTARQERNSMSMVDRIRKLFSSQEDDSAKINLLAERRAALSQRRDRLYEDIGKLEQREADLLEQGRQNSSQVVRRRLAAQLAQMRKDIGRANATAAMLNQQIDIISTDIHNLTLIQQGRMASLPNTEELTANAIRAEEMLETLKADADLVSSLESSISDKTISEDEAAIMAEFDAPATKNVEPAPIKTAQAPVRETPSAEPQRQPERRQANPEAT